MSTPNDHEDSNEMFVKAKLVETSVSPELDAAPVAGLNAPDNPQVIEANMVELVARSPRPTPFRGNFAAVGGAVGSCVLGVWSILGSLVTPFSAINGLIGVALGLWGLRSPRYKLSILGIFLAAIGSFLSVLRIPVGIAIDALMNEDAVLFVRTILLNLHG